jgi:hypothetical protein
MRQTVIQNVNMKAISNNPMYEQYHQTINAPTFDKDLEDAVKNPDTLNAKLFLQRMNRVIQFSGSKVPFSSSERKYTLHCLYSEMRWFGMSSYFITFAPCEMDNKTTIKIIISNKKKEYEKFINLDINDISTLDRNKIVNSNPVIATIIWKRMFDAFIHLLTGHDTSKEKFNNDLSRKSTIFYEKLPGIIGFLNFYRFVFECDGRNTLHTHGVASCTHVSPQALDVISDKNTLVELMGKTLNSHISSELATFSHVNRLFEKKLGLPNERHTLLGNTNNNNYNNNNNNNNQHHNSSCCNNINCNTNALKSNDFCNNCLFIQKINNQTNVHKCGFSCFKNGGKKCRYGMPRGDSDTTGPHQIETYEEAHNRFIEENSDYESSNDDLDVKDKEILYKTVQRKIHSKGIILPISPSNYDYKNIMDIFYNNSDKDRKLVWEIQRRLIDITEDDINNLQVPSYEIKEQEILNSLNLVTRPAFRKKTNINKDSNGYDTTNTIPDSLFKKQLPDNLKEKNLLISEFNDVLSLTLNCNQSFQFTGSKKQCIVAMFYLVKYLTKGTTDFHISF